MTAAEKRRARAREELRSEILEAARKIVLEQGYGALTMRRIAETVDYSAASIYQYFENRDAIAAALMEQGFEELVEALQPVACLADPVDRLEALARTYVAFGLERPQTYRLMFMEDPQITATLLETSDPTNSAGARAYGALLDPFVALAAAGRLAEQTDPHAAADVVWTALHGIVSLKLTCPKFPATPVEPLLDLQLRLLRNGLVR